MFLQVKPFTPLELTYEGMLERVHAYIKHQVQRCRESWHIIIGCSTPPIFLSGLILQSQGPDLLMWKKSQNGVHTFINQICFLLSSNSQLVNFVVLNRARTSAVHLSLLGHQKVLCVYTWVLWVSRVLACVDAPPSCASLLYFTISTALLRSPGEKSAHTHCLSGKVFFLVQY